MEDIYELVNNLLDQKENFVLATILKKSGSAPRGEGTKMLVKRDFSISGTIGGGMFEAMTIKASSIAFKNKESIIENFDLSTYEAISLGKGGSGDVEVLLEYVDCMDHQIVAMYKKAMEFKKAKTDFVLITKISEDRREITGFNKWICTETGFYGTENEELQCIIRKIRESFYEVRIHEVPIGKDRFFIEPFFYYESAYIMGAGHVAQKIADMVKMLGFYTIVVDDRKEFANRERFNTADEVIAVPSFYHLLDYVKIDNNSYVIIVTRGHSYDKEVLVQMLRTDAKYIGLIGNRSKRDFIYSSLLNEGFTPRDLERVYCPIGIHIYAETPEELAVSIAAELIKVKRGPKNEEE